VVIGVGMSAEVLAVKLGRSLATRAVQSWFAARKTEQEALLDLGELIRLRVPGLRAQRSVERQFEQIADAVATRLEPVLAHEYRGIGEGERAAAVGAVVDAFGHADLSDSAILNSDADPEKLARRIRADIKPPVGLGEAATALYDQLLAECCDYYIRILRHLPMFTERAVTELLARVSDVGTELSLLIERLPARTLYAPSGTGQDGDFRREYLGLISRTLDEVELFSFSSEQAARTKLSVAYISLRVSWANEAAKSLTRSSAGRRALLRSTAGEWESTGADSGGVRVETALGEQKRVLVRGEAGSGKTTLLHWLAITAARGAFTGELEPWNGLVPIVIKLRRFAGRDLPKPEEMLDGTAGPLTGHMPRGWTDRQLAAGQVLLMVDGVDELLPDERRKVREWLRLLLSSYPDTRALVTSRPAAAHEGWLSAEGFTPVSLERMTPTDLSAFIQQWHQAVRVNAEALPCPAEELSNYERALVANLRDRPHLQALASSPLLAGMLCALHLSRRQQLPRNRMELYRIAIELLVQRRDAERLVPSAQNLDLSLTDKLGVLRDLAWRLSDNNRSELDTGRALSHVAAKVASMRHLEAEPQQVLDHLVSRSGVLRSPVEGRIDFVHRTFQEYLAGAEAAAEDRIGNLIGRAHLDSWRETIIMAVGHANSSQRQELISGILDRAQNEPRHCRSLRLLAASCLETADSIPDELAALLDQNIGELVPPRRRVDSLSLAAVGEPLLRKLPTDLTDLAEIPAQAAIRTAALIGGKRALSLLAGYALDKRGDIQKELIAVWEYFDPTEYAEQVLALLPLGEQSLQLRLTRPSQWKPTTRLRSARRISIGYPLSLDDVSLDELPEVHDLWFTTIQGAMDLGQFSGQPGLQYLGCNANGNATLENTAALADLVQLRSLQLQGWNSLPPIAQIPLSSGLECLGLGFIPDNSDFDFLNFLPELTMLSLAGIGKPAWINSLRLGTGLARLDLSNLDLRDDLGALAEACPRVTSLVLLDCELPDDLTPLAKLTVLTDLRLYWCTGSDNNAVDVSSLARQDPRPRLTVSLYRTQTTSGVGWLGAGTRVRRVV
jgi:NACHT domain